MTRAGDSSPTAMPRMTHLIHEDGRGGGPVVVVQQLTHFRKAFEVSALHGGVGRIARACEAMGIPHHRLPLERPHKMLAGFPLLCAALIRRRPDVLVVHGQWAGPLGVLAGRLARVPAIVYVAHWPAFYTNWDPLRIVRNTLCEWIACHGAHHTVFLSESSATQYKKRRLLPRRHSVIPNGIDTRRAPGPSETDALREQHGWNDRHVHVVSVTRLQDEKRVDWLLRCWPLVHARAPSARLWIVGSGPDRSQLEQLRDELGLGETCQFLGEREHGSHYVAAAENVAMTTEHEAHAIVPLECMLCARPIVATDADGVRDSVLHGETGFLAPPGDAESMADHIIHLIADAQLRARVGRAARDRVARFDLSATLQQYDRLFARLLEGRNTAPTDRAENPPHTGTS